MNLKNYLKFYRIRKEITQAKLAEIAGVNETYYQNIEYGQIKPNVYTAQRLAAALGVTVEDLYPLKSEVNCLAFH